MKIKQYDVFELAKDLNPNITKGMRGVILEIWTENAFEVEFLNKEGFNYEYDGKYTFTIDKTYIDKITWTS